MLVDDDDFDKLVDACRAAHEAAVDHGTLEVQALTTALLHALAEEALRRVRLGSDGHG